MTIQEFNQLIVTLLERAREIRDAKRPSYTINSPDVLANFKNVGRREGLDPHKVLRVYQGKQQDAVETRHMHPDLPPSEPDLERYADIINYTLLDFAMLVEKQHELPTGPEFVGKAH